jgi:hypothetical protein
MATELRREMEEYSISFTQYIDDLCFSGDDDKAVRDMVNKVYEVAPRFEQHINRKKSNIMDAKHRQSLMSIVVNKKTKIDTVMIKKVEARIELIESETDGIIDSFTNVSIGGQILHIKKYDERAGNHLERLFNARVKNVYQGGSKAKNEELEACWDYRKDKSRRTKCQHLIS